jgi:hypothetical protein
LRRWTTFRGAVYTVFSEDELRSLTEDLQRLKASEKSFEFWDNPEDAIYDTLLMLFMQLDQGAVLQKETAQDTPRIIRFLSATLSS